MGKLAERYTDADRSGVYRVRDLRVPHAAACEANATIVELEASANIDAVRIAGEAPSCAEGGARIRVVLVTGADAPAGERNADPGALIDALGKAAAQWRAAGVPYFAVILDPGARLDLPRLYRE